MHKISLVGKCIDNSPIKFFWRILKREKTLWGGTYKSRDVGNDRPHIH